MHIFPEGTENRRYVTRDICASTVFVMLYAGAVEGTGVWVRPDQVTKMSDRQARKTDTASRSAWYGDSLAPGKMKVVAGRWYSVNTRESIRDETIRALINTGAVVERKGIPTTSSKPRYALAADFAALFAGSRKGKGLSAAITLWQETNLTPGALARLRLVRHTESGKSASVLVTFPGGETRRMASGPSSDLSKAVIEKFAGRYLKEPAVVFLSESRSKIVARDDELASSIGLSIRSDRDLPDIILADVGPRDALLVFVEVVSTDGPVSRPRRDSLLRIATQGGFDPARVAFVTAFQDRGRQAFRRLSSELAWGTFVWFASEPDCIIKLLGRSWVEGKSISELLG